MGNKLTTFQIILFVVAIFFIVGGVLVFALKSSGPKSGTVQIEMWGTIPKEVISAYQKEINDIEKESVKVIYKEFPENTFETELVNALASGVGPDAVIFPDDMLVKHEDKIFTIPYESYPQSNFKNSFIEAGDVLMSSKGISGVPFTIDPLVLYYNRTTLNSNGIANPPQYWDELIDLNPVLTKSDSSGNITKAMISLGEFINNRNASDILTTLIMQAGNPIIVRNNDDSFVSIFNNNMGYSVAPADAAINFFTQFSNPARQTYTWNRALPNADEMFLSGDLAFYIGFASERESLIQRNPNLNFGVSQMLQSRSSVETNSKRITGGKMYFMAVLRSSDKISGAFNNLFKMTSTTNMSLLNDITRLPSVQRSLLSREPTSDYLDTFNKSALVTKLFIEPDPTKADQILNDAISSVTSGRMTVSEILSKVNNDFNLLIKD